MNEPATTPTVTAATNALLVPIVDDAPSPTDLAVTAGDPATPGRAGSSVPAVEATGLRKTYGKLQAVDGIDLVVPRGSIFGLIGPNGAGKSTTFSMIATLLRPTSGSLRVLGHDPVKDPRAVRRVLGYMPDVLGVYDNLRVDEYLEFFAGAYHVPRSKWPELLPALLELVDLDVKASALVNSLSRGMKQRLSLARTLVHDPQLLVLDEPASGLDPRARTELRETVRHLQRLGKTIIVSSHILAELESMCSEIAIMEAGRVVAAGSTEAILHQLEAARTVVVRYANGDTESFTVAGDDEQAALLQRLITEGDRIVLEFRQERAGLEELFLRVTEGIVQ